MDKAEQTQRDATAQSASVSENWVIAGEAAEDPIVSSLKNAFVALGKLWKRMTSIEACWCQRLLTCCFSFPELAFFVCVVKWRCSAAPFPNALERELCCPRGHGHSNVSRLSGVHSSVAKVKTSLHHMCSRTEHKHCASKDGGPQTKMIFATVRSIKF